MKIHSGKVLDKVAEYSIIDCEACAFVHMDPIPTQEELDRVYREEYYTDEKPLFIERVIEDIDWWNAMYDDRYEYLESVLPDSRRRILDLGCGPGYFLKRGMERGWKGTGVEPSRQAGAHAKSLGVEVINTFFNDSGLKGKEAFDAVHLSEVLEHIIDPAGLLKDIHDVLLPGGFACAIVPNDYSPVQKLLRRKAGIKPFWLAPPHHINYFTYDSLSRLFERAGFEVTRRTAMFPIDFFLLMGDNYVGNDQLGRASHSRRKSLDLMLCEPELKGFKKELYELMANFNIGREMVVFGRKQGV